MVREIVDSSYLYQCCECGYKKVHSGDYWRVECPNCEEVKGKEDLVRFNVVSRVQNNSCWMWNDLPLLKRLIYLPFYIFLVGVWCVRGDRVAFVKTPQIEEIEEEEGCSYFYGKP